MKLYINGEFHAMDIARNVFSALLEENGAISDVGESDVLLAKYPDVEVIDLGGKCVIPGIIDSHAHIFMAAYSEMTTILPAPLSNADLFADLSERVKKAKKGQWIIYKNAYPLRLDELRYPSLAELDEIAPDNPVIVNGHYSAQVNSAALALIDLDNLNPGAAAMYDENGNPTGVLAGAKPSLNQFFYNDEGDPDEALAHLMQEYNKCGMTMIVDAMCAPDDIRRMSRLYADGKQNVRIRYTVAAADAVCEDAKSIDTGNREFGRLHFAKDFLDGGFLTATSYMEYPYHNMKEIFGIDDNGEDNFGMIFLTKEQLADKIRLARKYGLQYGAHCVGSGASRRLLDAYKIVNAEDKIKGERHALIHADFMDGDAIADANEMGISVLFQPAWHYMDAHRVDKFLHPKEIERFMKYTTLLTANLAAAGSDHMVKHDPNESVNPYNPFLGMYNMVTCKARDGKAYGAASAVGREHALIAYTRDAARVCFDEALVGTLEVGKRADFAVLDNNYFTCPEEEIPEIRAEMTVLDGRRVW